jgi:hypothetical protein
MEIPSSNKEYLAQAVQLGLSGRFGVIRRFGERHRPPQSRRLGCDHEVHRAGPGEVHPGGTVLPGRCPEVAGTGPLQGGLRKDDPAPVDLLVPA